MEDYRVELDMRHGEQKVVAFYDTYGNSVTYKDGEWQYPAPSEEIKTHLRSIASFLTRISKAAPKPKE